MLEPDNLIPTRVIAAQGLSLRTERAIAMLANLKLSDESMLRDRSKTSSREMAQQNNVRTEGVISVFLLNSF